MCIKQGMTFEDVSLRNLKFVFIIFVNNLPIQYSAEIYLKIKQHALIQQNNSN